VTPSPQTTQYLLSDVRTPIKQFEQSPSKFKESKMQESQLGSILVHEMHYFVFELKKEVELHTHSIPLLAISEGQDETHSFVTTLSKSGD